MISCCHSVVGCTEQSVPELPATLAAEAQGSAAVPKPRVVAAAGMVAAAGLGAVGGEATAARVVSVAAEAPGATAGAMAVALAAGWLKTKERGLSEMPSRGT